MKAVRAPVNIINFEIGIASFVLKFKYKIKIGTSRPPPPIPPAFERADPKNIKIAPIDSFKVNGRKFLCLQTPSMHKFKIVHSSSILHEFSF
jgi:hypothetical protein